MLLIPDNTYISLITSKNPHFVLLELCARSEYVKFIRDEIESKETLDYQNISQLPILDSFSKESMMVNPSDKSEENPRYEINLQVYNS